MHIGRAPASASACPKSCINSTIPLGPESFVPMEEYRNCIGRLWPAPAPREKPRSYNTAGGFDDRSTYRTRGYSCLA